MKPVVIIVIAFVLLAPGIAFGELAPFVDPNLDPQYYVDRYNRESTYREWFDEAYPGMTIYEAVGLTEPNYRITHIENFPNPLKSPQEYFDRYYSEPSYKSWFDSQFPNSSIEDTLGYHETHVDNFPDNSKSPIEYISRYYSEPSYKSWFDSQFPNSSIEEILGITPNQASDIIFQLGDAFYEDGDDYTALEYFQKSLKLDDKNEDAMLHMGHVYYYLDDYDVSNSWYNKVLSQNATNFEALASLAENYWELNKLSLAQNYADQARKVNESNPHIISLQGIICADFGRVDCLGYSDRALSIEPDDYNLLWDKAYILSSPQMGMYDEALEIYQELLKLDPSDVSVYNNMGVSYEMMGDKEKAEEYFQKALDIDPSDFYATGNLNKIQSADSLQTNQPNEESMTNSVMKLLELTYKIQISVEEGDETNARKYAKQLITLYENDIEPFMPNTPEKRKIANDIDLIKRELKMGEYAKPSIGGGCLIATATFDSELAPQVQKLREIRDSKLLQTESGSAFMESFNSFYYSFSPYIADYERENPVFKEMVKMGVTPLLTTLSLMDYAESESEVLGIGIGVILLNLGMYVGVPVFAIMRIRK